MTVGVGGRNLSGIAKGLSGWRLTHSFPCRHSSEGWNPGGRGREVQGWQSLSDGAFGCHSCDCHSRYAGMACVNHWIPACAGMTEGLKSGICWTWQKGLSGWQQTHADPRRHSSESWNPVVNYIHARRAEMTAHGLFLQASLAGTPWANISSAGVSPLKSH